MKRPCLAAFVLGAVALASTASAQLGLEILDYSPQVYSYEPVMVIFEARNTGSVGIAIPGVGCASGGASIEIGPVGGPLHDPHLIADCSIYRAHLVEAR